MRRLSIFAGLWLLAATAQAQDDRGPYIGVGVGVFSYEEVDEDFNVVVLEDTTSSYRLIGGFQINEGLAIEASWSKTGDIKESFGLAPPAIGTLDIKVDYEVAAVRAIGLVPLGRIDFFGGVGYYESTGRATVSTTEDGVIADLKDEDSGASLIGGAQFYFGDFTLRGEYQWFDTDGDISVWDIGISVLFHF